MFSDVLPGCKCGQLDEGGSVCGIVDIFFSDDRVGIGRTGGSGHDLITCSSGQAGSGFRARKKGILNLEFPEALLPVGDADGDAVHGGPIERRVVPIGKDGQG